MNKYRNIDYLQRGSKRQCIAYKELKELQLMEILQEYQPLLAGTIPLEIDIETSDLDILCTCGNHVKFSKRLKRYFSHNKSFRIETKHINDIETTICRFQGNYFPIEIFGQKKKSVEQDAFRHMLIEAQILQEKGSIFAKEITHLKKSGLKTEPAFAKLLGLKGNPYVALLNYKG